MSLSFKKGILLVKLGGEINNSTAHELDVLIDLISENGFSNVLIDIKAKIDKSGLKKINKIKKLKNVLII